MHRDCDHCESTEPVTHRVTPWRNGKQQEHLHTYLCKGCADTHREDLHGQGYGCVETRPILPLADIAAHLEGLTKPITVTMGGQKLTYMPPGQRPQQINISETVILEDVPERVQ